MVLWMSAVVSLVLSWSLSIHSSVEAFNPNWRFSLTLKQYEQVRDAILNIVGKTTANNELLSQAGRLQVGILCRFISVKSF